MQMQPKRNNVKVLQLLCNQTRLKNIIIYKLAVHIHITSYNITLLSFAVSIALTKIINPIKSANARLK